jgi:hypothetical protein
LCQRFKRNTRIDSWVDNQSRNRHCTLIQQRGMRSWYG